MVISTQAVYALLNDLRPQHWLVFPPSYQIYFLTKNLHMTEVRVHLCGFASYAVKDHVHVFLLKVHRWGAWVAPG